MISKLLLLLSHVIGSTKALSETFFDSIVPICSKKTTLIAFTIFLLSLALFTGMASNALINGDVALYEQEIIARLNFSRITVHLAYNLVGVLFTQVLPVSNDYALNLMNCFFGALTIALVYLITLTISKQHIPSIVSSLFLATNYIFVINAVYAEVYLLQTFFILSSLQCWLLRKPIFSGLLLALAILVTPSSIFALPCFIILRPHKRSVFLLCITVFAILMPAILPNSYEYLFGERGLSSATRSPFNVGFAVIKEGYEVIFGLFLCMPFMLASTVRMVREKRLWILGLSLLCFWLFNFLFAERFSDVPTQLPLYALLCVMGGLGFQFCGTASVREKRWTNCPWSLVVPSLIMTLIMALAIMIRRNPIQLSMRLLTLVLPSICALTIVSYTILMQLLIGMNNVSAKRIRTITYGYLILFVVFNAYLCFALVITKANDLVEYRKAVLEANEIAGSDYIVVGDWSQGILYEHYVFHEFNTGHWINIDHLLSEAWGRTKHEEAITEWQDALKSGRDIFVLGNYPTLFAELRRANYIVKPLRSIHYAKPKG